MIRARPIILSTSTWTGELKPAPDGIAHEKTREPEMHCPVSRFSLLGIVFSEPFRLVYRSVVKATLNSVCWPKLSITMNFNSEGLSLMLR